MKCFRCGKEYSISQYISLRRDKEDKKEKIDLCGNCLSVVSKNGEIKELTDKNKLTPYKVTLCPGYYDCSKIDNIRGRCEHIKPVVKLPVYMMKLEDIGGPFWCEPANAGIIKASIRLYDLFDNFDKHSTKLSEKMLEYSEDGKQTNESMLHYTKGMNRLTWFILVFTIINLIIASLNIYLLFRPT